MIPPKPRIIKKDLFANSSQENFSWAYIRKEILRSTNYCRKGVENWLFYRTICKMAPNAGL